MSIHSVARKHNPPPPPPSKRKIDPPSVDGPESMLSNQQQQKKKKRKKKTPGMNAAEKNPIDLAKFGSDEEPCEEDIIAQEEPSHLTKTRLARTNSRLSE